MMRMFLKRKVTLMTENSSNFYQTLGITISGMRNEINIGKNVVRVLGNPLYIAFRVNKSLTSIILFGCESTDPMSYKVPENFSTHSRLMRIYSKCFVRNALIVNHLKSNSTYTIYGKFYETEKIVRFDFSDAFENRMGLTD